ncbi:hypothetical protein GQX74_014653 [Glossina fuscipes]|nr:hypothetical protein GQX74_014653 [Glossina fuscipes]
MKLEVSLHSPLMVEQYLWFSVICLPSFIVFRATSVKPIEHEEDCLDALVKFFWEVPNSFNETHPAMNEAIICDQHFQQTTARLKVVQFIVSECILLEDPIWHRYHQIVPESHKNSNKVAITQSSTKLLTSTIINVGHKVIFLGTLRFLEECMSISSTVFEYIYQKNNMDMVKVLNNIGESPAYEKKIMSLKDFPKDNRLRILSA